jgi:hypothetical protein
MVTTGFVPGIYALVRRLEHKGVEARDKPGDDEFRMCIPPNKKAPKNRGL